MSPIFLIEVPHQRPASGYWVRSLKELRQAAYNTVCDDDYGKLGDDLEAAATEQDQVNVCLAAIGSDLHNLMVIESPRVEYRKHERARRADPTRQLFHQQDRVLSILADELRNG